MSAVVMGACRALVYVCLALVIEKRVSMEVGTIVLAVLAYVAGAAELTRASRFSFFALAMLLLAPFLLASVAGSSRDASALGFVILLGAVIAFALLRASHGESQKASIALLAGTPLVDAVVLSRFGYFALAVVVALLVPLRRVISETRAPRRT